MGNKGLKLILSSGLLIFYISIIMYVFFAIIHIDALANFEFAMAFEIIGFFILGFLILGNISRPMKIGYFVPLLVVTVVYTVVLDVINIALLSIPHVFFFLINFVLMFIYAVISIPMYYMGRR